MWKQIEPIAHEKVLDYLEEIAFQRRVSVNKLVGEILTNYVINLNEDDQDEK